MPVTITVNQNSYVDVEYADTYFASRLNSDKWIAASAEQKVQALIMATKKIDRQKINGIKADHSQVLQFPRTLYSYEPSILNNFDGKQISSTPGWVNETVVSECVKEAVCEEALALLKGIPKRLELQQQGVKSMSIGNLSETYSGSVKKLISQEALELLSPYLAGGYVIC